MKAVIVGKAIRGSRVFGGLGAVDAVALGFALRVEVWRRYPNAVQLCGGLE